MLYDVEKTPLVCRGRQGYVMARHGAGPGTQPPSVGSFTQASSEQEAHRRGLCAPNPAGSPLAPRSAPVLGGTVAGDSFSP